jgi:hypothetical protein
MGKDDLFRKRKEQKAAQLERQNVERTKGPRFLIVCEGKKTEPYYFEEICRFYELRTSRVRIAPGDKGSSPICVVNYAEELFNEDANVGTDYYDKIFCVIDRDKHDTYHRALIRVKELNRENELFVAISSVPCFEYWLLLHFTYTRQCFHVKGKNSICDCVIKELCKQPGFSQYSKGKVGIYKLLHDKTSIAIKHAQRAEVDAKNTREDNPSTLIHHLVVELQNLAVNHGRKR